MRRVVALVPVLFLVSLLAFGCGDSEEPAVEKTEPEQLDEETATAAASRGVAGEVRAEELEPRPQVVLSEMSYEWRNVPDVALHVELNFTNPAGGYERARGYVFLVAESTMTGSLVRGVYPRNTVMDGNLPEDHTDGTHLLYRDRQTVRASISYPGSGGHYEVLKLYVFHEDGRLLTNRTYDLEITGTPGERKTINPGFDL